MGKINASKAIQKLARRENISVQEVRAEMEKAIQAAYDNPEQEIRDFWKQIPRKGEIPTPEEFITYMAEIIPK